MEEAILSANTTVNARKKIYHRVFNPLSLANNNKSTTPKTIGKSWPESDQKNPSSHGKINFAGGGSFADVFGAFKDYGAVPNTVMPGLNYGEDKHRHGELDATTSAYVDAIIKNPNKHLSTACNIARATSSMQVF